MSLKTRVSRTAAKARALTEKAVTAVKEAPDRTRRARADHRARRTPTGFGFVLADAIGGLRPDHWDALVAGAGVCLSRPFLELLQEAGPEGLKGHYALVYQQDRPVAAIACQSLWVDAGAVPSKKEAAPSRLKATRDKGLAKVRQRVLVCGNLLGWGPQGVAFAPDADPVALWPAVAEALYRIRRADKLFGDADLVMVKDQPAEDAANEGLRPYAYRPLDTEPNMVLALKPEWDGFEAYLGALKSDYRSGIKKQIREVEAAGILVESLDAAGVARYAGAIHDLYLQVHDRQKLRLVTIDRAWIPSLAARFGADFRCTILRRPEDDRVLGFITTLKDGDGAIGYYIGFDKETAAQGVPLYLRLLYALVEDAIALRAAWVSLGRTALEPKAKLGAKPQPLRCHLRHRIPALNAVVSALLRAVPEPDQPPTRTPFKPSKA